MLLESVYLLTFSSVSLKINNKQTYSFYPAINLTHIQNYSKADSCTAVFYTSTPSWCDEATSQRLLQAQYVMFHAERQSQSQRVRYRAAVWMRRGARGLRWGMLSTSWPYNDHDFPQRNETTVPEEQQQSAFRESTNIFFSPVNVTLSVLYVVVVQYVCCVGTHSQGSWYCYTTNANHIPKHTQRTVCSWAPPAYTWTHSCSPDSLARKARHL